MFPLHLWLPNAYAFAPSIVSAFLAATATKVALYVMLRFMLGIFGADFALGAMPLDSILLVLGVAAILSASLVAIYQTNVKRMLAYSSVAQIGYMVLGIGLATAAGVSASVLHLFNHALMKGALFLALGAVVYRIGTVNLRDLAGLGWRMPWTTAAIVVGGLSLIGVPPTVGFISKWYLVLAIMERGWWPLAVIVLVGSVLALIYVWRLVEVAYLQRPAGPAPATKEAPLSMLAPIWLLVGANIYFGLATHLSVGSAQQVAALLMGGSQ
jgi:multicomponent Na+:H+ antiporter subunit D